MVDTSRATDVSKNFAIASKFYRMYLLSRLLDPIADYASSTSTTFWCMKPGW